MRVFKMQKCQRLAPSTWMCHKRSVLGPLLSNVHVNSLSTAVTKSELILYAEDAVLVIAACTSQELTDAHRHGFNQISNWHISNKLAVNVNINVILSGTKTMLSSFNDLTFFY